MAPPNCISCSIILGLYYDKGMVKQRGPLHAVSLPRPPGSRSLRWILRLMIAQTAPLKQKTSVYDLFLAGFSLFPIIVC